MSALYEIPHWHNLFSINSQEPNWNGQQNSGEFPLTSHVFCLLLYCTPFIVCACISTYSRPGSWGARIHSMLAYKLIHIHTTRQTVEHIQDRAAAWHAIQLCRNNFSSESGRDCAKKPASQRVSEPSKSQVACIACWHGSSWLFIGLIGLLLRSRDLIKELCRQY